MDMFKWYALNDNVMGGVSNGNVTKNDANNLSFWGKLSSENRGGFASCRTEIETGLLDGYSGLSFMVCFEWQEIAREEVDNLPISQIKKWDDVPKLSAFMYETLRWLPAMHRSLFHSATRSIQVAGYSFSKDTLFSFSTAGEIIN